MYLPAKQYAATGSRFAEPVSQSLRRSRYLNLLFVILRDIPVIVVDGLVTSRQHLQQHVCEPITLLFEDLIVGLS
jgi:hypothetical protein